MNRALPPPEFDYEVDHTLRIPTTSGLTLGATVVRPVGEGPFPAILKYDPYRGAWDGTAPPDSGVPFLVRRGYVFVYLHSRGTGNSEGLSLDEYAAEETQDGYDAVEWLARQSWCTGAVGMMGASYSGFTSLQVAAAAPPSLKAIAPAYFTDRRYTDDCHYKGGCLRGYYDTLTYGLSMVAMNALPPHPGAVGARWAEMWRERLEHGEPYLLKWLAHPVEDDYWAQGSVVGRYDRIRAASFLIGGWNDGYPNPPLRTFRALTAPKRLLMGPWSHTYPDQSHCGPRIHIYYELLRWWDRWLKGIDNGVEQEPRVMVYVRDFEAPVQDRTQIAGAWRASDDLPADPPEEWHLGAGTLARTPDDGPGVDRFCYRPAASRNGGVWDAGVPFTLPGDQRPDEAYALNYTSAPLEEDLVLFGQAEIDLIVSADVPVIPLAVRICEVAEDGTSALVAKGILNAARREGMDRPLPLTPGEPVPLCFDLEATAWRLRKGHRLRVSINGSDFPNVWPTPYAGTGGVHRGPGIAASIRLPVWSDPEPSPIEFFPSEAPARSTGSGGDPPPWRVVHDVLEDRAHFVMASGKEFVVSDRDPASAYARATNGVTAAWEGFRARAEATASLVSDAQAFHLTLMLVVTVNDAPFHTRQWCRTYPRELL